ncbi:MAG: hypothetical protein ACO1HP_04030, partial [Bacteroidota bacterium]
RKSAWAGYSQEQTVYCSLFTVHCLLHTAYCSQERNDSTLLPIRPVFARRINSLSLLNARGDSLTRG